MLKKNKNRYAHCDFIGYNKDSYWKKYIECTLSWSKTENKNDSKPKGKN